MSALPAPAPSGSRPDVAGDPFAAAVRQPGLRDRLRVPDQAMSAGAAVLLPLGLVMVFLSWYGAARTPYLFEQVPYLISGGLLGLGLVLTGGFVLFGSWIARTARQQQAISNELLEAVRAVRDEISQLQAGTVTVPAQAEAPVAARRRRNGTAASNGSNGSHSAPLVPGGLVATANGSMLHRPDCSVVANREDVHAVSDKESGVLQPCRLCSPLSATARV